MKRERRSSPGSKRSFPTWAAKCVLSTDKWGTRKLAYPINYKNDAFYVLMTFEADGNAVKELDRIAGITDEVIRRMITKAN